jgi:hypothetical protein
MEIEIFTVCDFSEDIANKMVIVGTFDTIWAKIFPAVHPSFSIAARFRFSKEELGEHKFKILFTDEKENNFLPPIEGGINVKSAPGLDHATVNLSLNIGQPTFPQPGKYSVQFHLDGKWKTGLNIYLIKQ